ncbi:MAG: hypothetical protein KME60_08025 [Cyanomargarita calcarea GSE-NOS-MK-12-04C]|jgi:hypothetical protein|uniref:Uncharacterized protein n=1 Tax=Cyanomargarita calcarea GSE-NOS-MK-12-04C TaxID=2839659 RepID=A0A951QJ20_9CYAN|nr:hypothetical protein [Cyanomargarita calcarea GSE-NOS-MK-12-04C]
MKEFTEGYIYYKQLLSYQEVLTLINKLSKPQSYYFLRYSHAVSGICIDLPADRGEIEGQMFNAVCELRWKKYKSGYEVLILSKQEFRLDTFDKLSGHWEICDHNAYWHDLKETKFPKGFIFKDVEPNKIPIKQRYFQNSATATVHFVALTVN